ncbi:transcription elongation GreA/GreB family factor [Sphingomonas insulae]|uniref:Transcription elongation factor GreA n=1 Tax=Sphingomonas insulae TaxID=424800 RepID=A0ABN1HVK8_9SPHN|nr:GreA/GreB family elongation factor [Sphingomonas insulae]NIJ28540.1 transcription elongation GreA/GreB family factor [Sphingomonas insulae]
MSVAFRRESDEEHLEPKFELPIPTGPNLVTRAGKALIETRIAALKQALEQALAQAGAEAVDAIRRDLRYWQTRRTTAVPTAAPADGSAGFGTRVQVTIGGRERAIAIVGDDEADPRADRLAFGAPLARALIGAEPGDILPFGGRDDAIEVVAVEPIDAVEPS